MNDTRYNQKTLASHIETNCHRWCAAEAVADEMRLRVGGQGRKEVHALVNA